MLRVGVFLVSDLDLAAKTRSRVKKNLSLWIKSIDIVICKIKEILRNRSSPNGWAMRAKEKAKYKPWASIFLRDVRKNKVLKKIEYAKPPKAIP